MILYDSSLYACPARKVKIVSPLNFVEPMQNLFIIKICNYHTFVLHNLQITTAVSKSLQSAVTSCTCCCQWILTIKTVPYASGPNAFTLVDSHVPGSVQVNCCWRLSAQSFLVPSPTGLMIILFCLTALGVLQLLRPCWSSVCSFDTD